MSHLKVPVLSLNKSTWISLVASAAPLLFLTRRYLRKRRAPRRSKNLPKTAERVLIVGGSSGIGRALALQYAARGARVGVLGRREKVVQEVVAECDRATLQKGRALGLVGDFSNIEDMIRVRETLKNMWGGIDTIHICAGVSALQPILALADAEHTDLSKPHPEPNREGIKNAVDIALGAQKGNFIGPLVVALTLIPLLTNTSPSPSILLVSSVGAVTPAPTRSLYQASKSASLLLYQGLAAEHSDISFTMFMPATIEGDNFRSSAIDKGPVRESDPNKAGLKAVDVATRCIRAIDEQEKTVFMPGFFRLVPFLYWIYPGPSWVEAFGRRKFNYTS